MRNINFTINLSLIFYSLILLKNFFIMILMFCKLLYKFFCLETCVSCINKVFFKFVIASVSLKPHLIKFIFFSSLHSICL